MLVRQPVIVVPEHVVMRRMVRFHTPEARLNQSKYDTMGNAVTRMRQ